MVAEVVQIYDSNSRDPAATPRKIADRIDAGDFGDVGCAALVVLGDTTEVFGMGQECEGPPVAMLLYAGFLRIAGFVANHGRD